MLFVGAGQSERMVEIAARVGDKTELGKSLYNPTTPCDLPVAGGIYRKGYIRKG